jgi:hypothetical protein
MRQVLPFHRSTIACALSAKVKPTAVHELLALQETAASEDGVGLFGVRCTRQRSPFQTSISGVFF